MVGTPILSALQHRLIARLERLPDYIRLTPLNGNKQPQGKDWTNRPFTPTQMIDAVRNGVEVPFENKSGEIYQKRIYPKGFGLMTGPVSGGILATDFDGASALEKFIELNGGLPPITEGFTSRPEWEGEYPDHFQLTFWVPQEFWGSMKNKVTIPTKWEIDPETGKEKVTERLELRWSNMQSVLPPSIHPETGSYRDLPGRAFGETKRAEAPMWVIENLLIEPETSTRPQTSYTTKLLKGEEWSNEEWALSYLSALSSTRADDYDDWVAVGMALHSVSDSLLSDWDNWSRQSPKYKPGACEKKWKSFKSSGVAIGTLGHMAKLDGWRSPFNKNPNSHFNTSRKSVTPKESSEPKLDIVERFKADLLTLTNTADPIVQLLKINELAATYRMPAGEIRKAIAKIETATRTPKAKFFKLDEFLSLETEGIDYLIPGLLPRGETVLCVGLPKSGKTLLTIDAAFAVATGESKFLGETVQQGKVLVVSVDESAQSTKLKLMKRGFRASDAENIAVMTTWDVSQMAELEAKLEDFRPDLVIIDSLKRITAGREISENSAEFADIIYQLKELLGRYGASSILVHHSNKSQDAVGVGKVRGSTAIAGACWGLWQLDHIIQTTDENGKPIKGKPKFDPSDPRRIFTAICRDADSQTLTIQFNPENHSYGVASEDREAQQERKTQEQLILELLTQYHPNGLTGREIMEALGLGRGIYTILDRMVGRKTVTQRQSKTDSRSMVYALPQKRNTHPPSPSLQMLTNFSETTVVEPKTNSQQIVNNESPDSQRRFDLNEGVDYSIPEQVDISGDSQQLLAPGGGVCLSTDEFTQLNADELSHNQLVKDVQPEAIAKRCCEAQIATIPVEQKAPTSADEAIAPAATTAGEEVSHAEPDFDTFPHTNPCAAWGVKRSKAEQIKREILEIDCIEDFRRLRDNPQYSRDELNWVRKILLTKQQRDNLKAIVEVAIATDN